MKELSDIELLDAYASQRSEEAFRALVTRHVDFVYSAAMRQLRNPHLAQEATQAAFIALAGKAGQLRRPTVIAGWLHRAVHFAGLNLQRTEARRKHWEVEAATMNAPGEAEQDFQSTVLPLVDDALAELSESDRDAVILRFLHHRSLHEVAETLGTSEEAAKKRVSRAVDRLRGLLARRGVAIPAAALAAGLSQMPVSAAPAAFSTTLAALAAGTPVAAAATSAAIHTLLRSAKAKLVLAGLILLGGVSALLWLPRVGNTVETSANPIVPPAMKINLTSVIVDDQEKARRFYTEVLGFVQKMDFPTGGARWLTVVSPDHPDGPELLLEPMGFPPSRTYQAALRQAGIPLTAFEVGDVQKAYERMTTLGAVFTVNPTTAGPVTIAVLEDTCGNLIQLFQPAGAAASSAIKIKLTSVMVSDQDKALKFYTEVLGFAKKRDLPVDGGRWLTVVSPHEPEGPELVLEPTGFPPAKTFQNALFEAGIPLTSFSVEDIQRKYESMRKLGVVFRGEPTESGPVTTVEFEDTCGNLIQITQN